MTVALTVAALAIWPARWPELAPLVLGVLDVRLGIGAVAGGLVLAARRESDDPGVEVAYLAGLAASIRGGQSIRAAISGGGATTTLDTGHAERLARAGAPIDEVAEALGSVLPRSGRALGLALTAGSLSGGRMAGTVDSIVQMVFDEVELEREISSATAQARASAWLIGAIPLLALAGLAGSGRFGALAGLGPAGWGLMSLGVAMLSGGAFVMLRMAAGAWR